MEDSFSRSHALVVGPGLGRDENVHSIISSILITARKQKKLYVAISNIMFYATSIESHVYVM